MRNLPFNKLLAPFLILLTAVSACEGSDFSSQGEEGIKASGVVEIVDIAIASELPGKVADIHVHEGDPVDKGDPLFVLDGELIQAQYQQALSALEMAEAGQQSAQANLDLAQTALDSARIQYQQTLAAAQVEALPLRLDVWNAGQPGEFDLPSWYFTQDEKIAAAEIEVENAAGELLDEQDNFEKAIAGVAPDDFAEIEIRLAKAQAAFLVIEDLLERRITDGEEIDAYLDFIADTVQAELDSAQLEYDRLLSEQDQNAVFEARARLTIAQERYDAAVDRLNSLLTGSHSFQVKAALTAVAQAEANLDLAEAMLAQASQGVEEANAGLRTLELHIERLTVSAPAAGVVMTRSVEPGEIVQPGQVVLILGQLDELTVTVYIPEDRYGNISLGDTAEVITDSFPGTVFNAVVTRISDEAEYTPRNVQTEEERRNTVFAIELAVEDLHGQLKPGMPVDVVFSGGD